MEMEETSTTLAGSPVESAAGAAEVPMEPPGVQVLIPQNYPGAFYYPPCKCDLLNQIRYFNPKTRQFYYHAAYPPPGSSTTSSVQVASADSKDFVLAGEPETFSEYSHPYFSHHMVPAGNHVLQGPYMQPGSSIPQSPYSVPVVPIHESGLCELVLVILVLLLWLYSFYRLYLVWQKTLNFSEASIQGPQGWDLLVNWVMERIQEAKCALMEDEKWEYLMKSRRNAGTYDTFQERLIRELVPFRKKSVIPPGVSGTKDSKESDIEVDMEDDSLDSLVRQNNDSHSRNLEDDLDRIEKAASSPTSSIVDATERGKLKLTLMKDYDQHHISRSSSGSSIPMKTSHSKVHQQPYPLSSHPCSLQILHEDETSPRIPPPPLAVFGGIGVKLTATQMRRARMMNKQMSEDCARQHLVPHTNKIHEFSTRSFRKSSSGAPPGNTRSLQKLTDSCEMKDLTGTSIYEAKNQQKHQFVRKQYSLYSSDAI